MYNEEVALDNARNNQLNKHLDSLEFDESDLLFLCLECKQKKPLIDMFFVHDCIDEGCCSECAKNPDIAEEWI